MAKHSGITEKETSEFSEFLKQMAKENTRVNRTILTVMKMMEGFDRRLKQEKVHNKMTQDRFFYALEKQIDGSLESQDDFRKILQRSNNVIGDLSSSIAELKKTLEDLELKREIIRDKEVQRETGKVKREMTRRQILSRGTGFKQLISGLFASQRSPKFMQYISGLVGLPSFEQRKEEQAEKEQLEADIAQTKINLIRQKKRYGILGIKGEGETVPELLGQEGKEVDINQQAIEFMDAASDMTDAMKEARTDIAVTPMLRVGREEGLERKAGRFMGTDIGEIEETTLPFEGGEGGAGTGEPIIPITPAGGGGVTLTKEEEEQEGGEEIGAKVSILHEGELVADSNPLPVKIMEFETFKDDLKSGIMSAFQEIYETTESGITDTAEEDETGVISPGATVTEGPITALGKKLGKGIGGTVKKIPIIGTTLQKHQHGGDVTETAGTGTTKFAMNPNEGINVPYDNMAMEVPGNLGLKIVKEADMEKLNRMNEGGGNPNARMEQLLQQLIATNEKANTILQEMMAEKPEKVASLPPSLQSFDTRKPRRSASPLIKEVGVL